MHGLRTHNKAFFHWNPELLGLGRQIRQINSEAFGIFSAKLSAPILVKFIYSEKAITFCEIFPLLLTFNLNSIVWCIYKCCTASVMVWSTDYGHMKAKFLIRYKGLFFCRNNCWIMEKMNEGLTVPKWVLIVWPKIPQMPQKFSAQNVCPGVLKKALTGCP